MIISCHYNSFFFSQLSITSTLHDVKSGIDLRHTPHDIKIIHSSCIILADMRKAYSEDGCLE